MRWRINSHEKRFEENPVESNSSGECVTGICDVAQQRDLNVWGNVIRSIGLVSSKANRFFNIDSEAKQAI